MAETPWAQFVSTTDILSDPVEITKDRFVIGRSKAADLCLHGNKFVSGLHCVLWKDDDGKVWLEDTSSNGTLVDGNIKLKKKSKSITHGTEISVVFKKDEASDNVSYVFQDLSALQQEALDESSEPDASTNTSKTIPDDQTMAYFEDTDDEPENIPESRGAKRKADEDTEKEEKEMSRKKSRGSDEDEKTDENVKTLDGIAKETLKEEVKKSEAKEASTIDENKTEEKEKKKEESCEGNDDIEENLQCIICQELLHDCISCQPCMHTFCSGCYSDWMKISNECPSCRGQVDRVNKNHIVNNLVEAYLKINPSKARPKEEIEELDKKNTIKGEMLKPPPPKRTMSEYIDEEGSDEYSNSEDDDDEEEITNARPFIGHLPPPDPAYIYTGTTNIFGTYTVRPPTTLCRQCPGYKGPGSAIGSAISAVGNTVSKLVGIVTGRGDGTTNNGAGTSTDGAATNTDGAGTSTAATSGDASCSKCTPTPPAYECKASQVHILCRCCLQPMPDRRTERASANPGLPAQQCSHCFNAFCHLYWGCQKVDCAGCLAQFKDIQFRDTALDNLILNNTFESNILKTHLKEIGFGVKELFNECCTRLDNGEFSVPLQPTFEVTKVLCYKCALRVFADLAYQYMEELKRGDLLPTHIALRPNCYWGKNCRTQTCKPHHAANFNHVCEQTRR